MKRVLLMGLTLIVTATACSNSNSPALPSIPATPTVMTETFTGTVPLLDTHNGAQFHNFTITVSGSISVTLTAAGPPPTIHMSLGVGTPSAETCAILANGSVDAQAGTTAQLTGTLTVGTYCVQVADVGNQVFPVDYSVTVVHS